MTRRVRLGFAGAGAVVQQCHLPAVTGLDDVEVACIYDANIERAGAVAKRFRIGHVATSLEELGQRVDAAVVATPNDTHAAYGSQLLRAGVHVLCEKPVALKSADLEIMLSAAESAGVLLLAGQVRRFSEGNRLVRRLLNAGVAGRPVSVIAREGQVGAAMSTTLFALNRTQAGGGVLLDWGSHVLDLLCYWLGAPAALESYRDNSLGGVESDCALRLRYGATGDIVARVQLSRTVAFDEVRVGCEGGELSTSLINDAPIALTLAGEALVHFNAAPPEPGVDPFRAQMANFVAAVKGKALPEVPAAAVAPTVALIERCYAERRPLFEPWMPH